MSGSLIRDVVIRVALEMGSNNLNFDSAAMKSYQDNLTRHFQQKQMLSEGSVGAQFEAAQQAKPVSDSREIQPPPRTQPGGRRDTDSGESLRQATEGFKSLLSVAKNFGPEASKAASAAGLWLTRIGSISTGMQAAGLVVEVGIKTLALALREAKETSIDFSSSIARDTEQAASRTGRNLVRHAGERFAVTNSRFDMTDVRMLETHGRRESEREQRIQQEQTRIAHRPLAERQEVRHRIESEGRVDDQVESVQGRIQFLRSQNEDFAKQQVDLKKYMKAMTSDKENAAIRREEERKEMSPDLLGGLIGRTVNPNALVSGTVESVTSPFGGLIPVPQIFNNDANWGGDGIANYFGMTTEHESERLTARSRAEGAHHQERLQGNIQDAQQQSVEITKRQRENHEQIARSQAQKLELSRGIMQESRASGENAREDLRSHERAFGGASMGEQFMLRSIQAKANRIKAGGTEKFFQHEIATAERFGIDAVDQIHEQEEAEARKPENLGLFANRRAKAAAATDRENNAKKNFDKDEQELLPAIRESGNKVEAVAKQLVEETKKLGTVADLLEGANRNFEELNRRIDEIAKKNQRWFG